MSDSPLPLKSLTRLQLADLQEWKIHSVEQLQNKILENPDQMQVDLWMSPGSFEGLKREITTITGKAFPAVVPSVNVPT